MAVLLDGLEERQSWFFKRLRAQPKELSLLEALQCAITEDELAFPWTGQDAARVRVFRTSAALAREGRGLEAQIESEFAAWIAERLNRRESDLAVRTAAAVLVSVRRVVVEEWQQGAGVTPVSEIAETALEMLHVELN